ncbi:MAG: hypothetical protein LUG16_00085 [Candidatus Gastranaerophilales bacterium]|nr:hypothetical protein [Candidatus Gastranaerophilales bacterium]
MKKVFITGLVLAAFMTFCNISTMTAIAADGDAGIINAAIAKYKAKDYLGCISELREYTDYNPDNAVAWYYLGSSYMQIAMQDEAIAAFDEVIALDTVPQLTSYSIQAQMCIEDASKCNYKNFNLDEILKLKENPVGFFQQYFANLNIKPVKQPGEQDIENLINGSYSQNIHPSAQEFIRQERAKMQQNEMNTNKA